MTAMSPQGHRGGKKKGGHDCELDEHLTPPPVTGSRKARKSSNNQQGSHQNQGSPLDTDRLMQKARQEVQPLIVDGRDVLTRFNDIVFSPRIRAAHKAGLLHNELRQIIDLQEKKSQAEIASLKQDTQFAIADATVEIATLKRQYEAMREARSVLQNDNEELQNENVRLKLCRELNENVEAAVKSGYEELEKMYHEYKSSIRLNQAGASGHKSQKTSHEQDRDMLLALVEGNGDGHFTANSGSYTDDSATPNLLANVFNDTKTVVTRFQKELFKAFKSTERNPSDLLKSDQIVFARENHLGFYLKSFLNEMFFEGFENEGFNTSRGISRFPDPNVRQRNFYEYYENNKGDIDDPQFGEFCEAKLSSLWERFPLYNKNEKKVCCFEELGGFELGLQLALSFKEAVKSVWLLHKLAFSFEPPASIFRVEQGFDVHPAYMDAIVKLEDDQRFVSKVGFMVTPGLRLGKTVMRCEVYLGGSADGGTGGK